MQHRNRISPNIYFLRLQFVEYLLHIVSCVLCYERLALATFCVIDVCWITMCIFMRLCMNWWGIRDRFDIEICEARPRPYGPLAITIANSNRNDSNPPQFSTTHKIHIVIQQTSITQNVAKTNSQNTRHNSQYAKISTNYNSENKYLVNNGLSLRIKPFTKRLTQNLN